MKLNFNIDFKDLYSVHGLNKLHKEFEKYILNFTKINYTLPINSVEIIELAQIIEVFIAELFFIKEEVKHLKNLDINLKVLHECKRKFIQRQLPDYFIGEIENIKKQLKNFLCVDEIDDVHYAKSVLIWLEKDDLYKEQLYFAKHYAKYMIDLNDDNKSILFKIPQKIILSNLINIEKKPIGNNAQINTIIGKNTHERDGFELKNNIFSNKEASDNAHYCIFCHERNKDTCRKGTFNKVFSQAMTGCPLDQKISEMNYLKSQGFNIAALSVITLDNPMCAATGHRICNDCMKACIFQKQEPVNVPGVESNILDSVLSLPYGFEIYSLLTKWNPMATQPTPKNFTGYNVLVSGMGPAGFTTAHYLLNEGHNVVAIDGNKIEIMMNEFSGLSNDKKRINFKPIKNIKDIFENSDERIIQGFGGVSEYGITVRWDKNYLKIIKIMLERRDNFRLYGSTRFGSNISFKNFYSLQFHHLVLAIGATLPNIPNIKNLLIKGVRFASDFLMSLHLGGAFKKKSLTSLQLRMPIVVIGGGLTAIDVATEALEYYKSQIINFYYKYTEIINHFGIEYCKQFFNKENIEILNEFLLHAKELRNAKSKLEFLKSIGGVKIIYYKSFEECNSYKQNHEEVREALKQGIEFIENINPVEFISDEYGAVNEILALDSQSNKYFISAKSVIIAVGNKKNIFSETEFDADFNSDDFTLVGDIDPKYSGSVVRAMSSAKDSYKIITKKLSKHLPIECDQDSDVFYSSFFNTIHKLLNAQIIDVKEIAKDIIELIIHAPLAAQNFEPGQFYKLQNYATLNNTRISNLLMEPIALTGANVNKEKGIISLIVLEYGASSKLCRYLSPGENISLMGPTGEPTEVKQNENVLFLGGGLGNAVLFSIGAKMRSIGCKVNYIAGYKTADSIFKTEEIENASDFLIWACEEKLNMPLRNGDKIFHGNIIDALNANINEINLSKIDRIITIGSDRMMHAVQNCFSNELKNFIKPNCKLIASINSPMQCMMKGVCAQCLQKHNLNAEKEMFIYSCKTQDQNLCTVDFQNLSSRLKQNNLSEIVTNLWTSLQINHE